MTLAEFKAWFEGFTEDMEAAPTPKQWKRIKARVAQIDGTPVTREVIYRDRYWPSVINTSPRWDTYTVSCGLDTGLNTVNVASNMVDLGRAEYSQALAS